MFPEAWRKELLREEVTMSESIQERPAPRFKIDQAVGFVDGGLGIFKIKSASWREDIQEWSYFFYVSGYWRESGLRPLSIEEIGSDELLELARRLEGADSRRADMERERDEARAELADLQGLCGRLTDALKDANETCRNLLNGITDPVELDPQGWSAVIAEAETAMKDVK